MGAQISIRKERGIGELVFIIKIFTGLNKKPSEIYVIGEERMYEMFFGYPSFIKEKTKIESRGELTT